ncbi:phosphodiester glycosidase family protein [Paenibacillus xylaniclasticus]|uniref:phosphodiester glycosidase family protein n=1 Tax=Paenibacillus xylaniclasticus TaxID=588083 RepID=UPI000FD76692|nr:MULTISPECIES: phosphodiester glycosidase family protein [Paenibacillus]GFN31951.1 exopolysaccharide biosynthesis protein [Paenibacillus curdlanolyticus]
MNKMSQRLRITLAVTAVLVLVIGAVLYKLADRYLIEHVEVVLPDDPAASDEGQSSISNAQFDDWHYSSDQSEIAIQKVQTGTGKDAITYFVADVKLKNGATLQSAFAKNQFGRNIIDKTSTIAAAHNAVLAINGDYYGFRSDGVIIRNGVLYRDEPARTGLALFQNGTMKSYDEQSISSSELLAQGVTNTFSFGPALLIDGQITSSFEHVEIDTNFGNRSIQNSNPRTGIGIIEPNHYVFVVVDGRANNYSRGMTLAEFADLFQQLGCTEAYNLDGGGSSTMYFMGRVVNNPQGRDRERGVSDIVYVGA